MTRKPDNSAECGKCHRIVGVQRPYNLNPQSASSKAWRLAAHGETPGGPRCPLSRTEIPEERVLTHV